MPESKTNSSQSVTEQARAMLTSRLSELQERRTEFEQNLAAINGEATEIEAMLSPAQPEAPQQQPARRTRATTSNGSGSSEPSGRAKLFLDSVRKNPGQPVTFHAAKMGLKQPNYLYRIRGQLEEQGLLRRENDGSLVAVES